MQVSVAVVGLGYVGLPLALAFGRLLPTLGYDIASRRVAACRRGCDPAGEMPAAAFADAEMLSFSTDPADLRGRDFYIITVPTPVDDAKRPDLDPLIKASETVGAHIAPS